ncbi:helicase associated domain-containing protein [Kitasatospora sp. NPDC057904]|uniref:helicase associated domain-containing protein n=1 Tax=Kitasatospora sp. NPDC057904 TaxID=3346275 RepID=UPI0036DC72F7
MNPRPAPGVTLALDPGDDAAFIRAALAAHDPAAGRITVHPTPGTTRADDLALDILAALGKPYTPPGPWSGAQGPLWAAAAAWILTTSVHHLTVLRAHLLAPTTWRRLLDLQLRTGIHLTVGCHRTPPPALTAALHSTAHTTTTGLPPYALPDPAPRPPIPPIARAADLDWLAIPALTRLALSDIPEPPCTTCTPAPATNDHLPPPPPDGLLRQAAERIHHLAHPQHAAALVIALVTGAPFHHLATATPADYHPTHPTLTLHAPRHGRTPARCATYELPPWARPLMDAATHFLNLTTAGTRLLAPPGHALAPLLQSAEHCRLRPPQHSHPNKKHPTRYAFPAALPDGPDWTAFVDVPNVPPHLAGAVQRRRRLQEEGTRWREWERMYADAAAFHAEHHHLDPTDPDHDGPLMAWIARQRHLKGCGELAPARITELDALGMIWSKNAGAWERGHAYARAWAARTGHLAIPAKETLDGYAVGAWMRRQRKAGGLTDHQHHALDVLDTLWQLEPDWNRSYRRLTAYLSGGGSLIGPANRTGHLSDSHFRPGSWLRKQNRLAVSGGHTAQQTALLDALGAWQTAFPPQPH